MKNNHTTSYKRTELIFDEVARNTTFNENDTALLKKILLNYDLRGKTILEVGCGIGDNLIYCVHQGADYAEGFDISSESIRLAQSKIKREERSNLFFHKCSLEEYSTIRRFDVILVVGVFEYFNHPLDALKKICTLLKDEGMIIIVMSKPIFIKKISFLFRAVLSKIPLKIILPVAKVIGKCLNRLNRNINKRLSTAGSTTYTLENAIIEGLMVRRYNVCNQNRFCDYLYKKGFSFDILDKISPSMTCLVARKRKEV